MAELFLEYSDEEKFFPDFDKNLMNYSLSRLLDDFSILSGRINISVLSENNLLAINEKYLKHYDYTDIITFDYSFETIVAGDLFISGNRCFENAKSHKVLPIEELKRYIIHGVLHLCGMEDKTDDLRQQMRDREDFYLDLI